MTMYATIQNMWHIGIHKMSVAIKSGTLLQGIVSTIDEILCSSKWVYIFLWSVMFVL